MIKTELIKTYYIARNISYFSLLAFSRIDENVMNLAKYVFENNPVNDHQTKCKKRHKGSFELNCTRGWKFGNHNFITIFRDFMLKKYNMKISCIKTSDDGDTLKVRFNIVSSVKIHNYATY